LEEEEQVMRDVPIGRAAVVGLALLLLLSGSSVCLPAKEVIVVKVTSLKGTANVTKPDGTVETLTDTSKPIALPATIEMAGLRGSFVISLPSEVTGKFNTVSWTQRQGETVKVSLLKNNKGVRFEYLKGTRKFFVDVVNRENVLLVRSISGTTSLVILQNKVIVPEKAAALLTCPMNTLASVIMASGQVSEVELDYSAKDRYIRVLHVLSEVGTVRLAQTGLAAAGGPVVDPTSIPQAERLVIPVPSPEILEQSPFRPSLPESPSLPTL